MLYKSFTHLLTYTSVYSCTAAASACDFVQVVNMVINYTELFPGVTVILNRLRIDHTHLTLFIYCGAMTNQSANLADVHLQSTIAEENVQIHKVSDKNVFQLSLKDYYLQMSTITVYLIY